MGISYRDFEPLLLVLVFGLLGFVMSMIVKTLYDNGIIIQEYLTGSITLVQVQVGCIVLFLILGIVVVATRQS